MSVIAPLSTQPVLTLRKAADVVAESITWTVDQIIPAGMLTVLSGKDKVGKTLFAWELARAVCRSEAFLEQFPVTTGPVLFLALDDPAVVTVNRLEQLGIREESNLHIATPLDYRSNGSEFWNEVRTHVSALGARLVIVDALYLFLRGADSMNQAGGMAPVMLPLNSIAEETGASILLITHDTKAGGDVAGSFVIRAAAKQILRLSSVTGEPSKRILQVESKVIERCDWALGFDGPGTWRLLDADAERLPQTRAAVADWLQQANRGTAEAIATAIHKRRADVETVIRQMQAEASVGVESVSRGRGRPAQEYHWITRPEPMTAMEGTENA